jgi:hypothetical protein
MAMKSLYNPIESASAHAKLEAYLGQPLLIREGKRFTLTTAGNRSTSCSSRGCKRRITGRVGLKLYPHWLNLQKRHPKLVVEYQVDVAIMTCRSTVNEVSLKPIAEETLLLALGFIDHPDGAYHVEQLLSA